MPKPIELRTETIQSKWYIWLFPVIAVGICGWLLYAYLQQQGPAIKIYFDDASNIQAGKTPIRFRGVTIGKVAQISISPDNKDVVAEVDLQSDAEQFAVEGSKFWIVAPKVNFSGVSGLETIFEGTYIAVQPGNVDGNVKYEFKGQMGRDSNESFENTTFYILETANAESISSGDVVSFRGVNVGSIAKVTLAKTAQAVHIQINIHNRYVKLIRTNTVFWKKAGIQAKFGLFGSEVKVNSVESIMQGGVEFFTPEGPGEVAKANSKFRLELAAPKGSENWNPNLDL